MSSNYVISLHLCQAIARGLYNTRRTRGSVDDLSAA